MVICHASGGGNRFWWEGTDVLVPRRPLDDYHASTLAVDFAAEPATIVGIEIHLQGRDDGPDLDWAGDTPDTLSGVHIDSSGHRFLLTGLVTEDSHRGYASAMCGSSSSAEQDAPDV